MKRYIDLDDGYSWHIESTVRGVTLCGRRFEAADVVERASKAAINARFEATGDKPGYCFDCLTVHHGGEVSERRRELHFS